MAVTSFLEHSVRIAACMRFICTASPYIQVPCASQSLYFKYRPHSSVTDAMLRNGPCTRDVALAHARLLACGCRLDADPIGMIPPTPLHRPEQ